ncbi:MAG TPA: ribulokinase [Saprospiraceae bacterium]|nr:ribulokinase [Saprospiraceae bacterium]HMP22964.1 ribulokinase [Saprospiraceae bacterium]
MSYVIGIDYGTDSVRSLIVDTQSGTEIASGVFYYPRWQKGLYCNPARNQFRQHPLDYVEGIEIVVQQALATAPAGSAEQIKGIAIDTTGSTPVAVDKTGTPLALLPQFAEHPHAMFLLWKDHTAIREAAEINDLCGRWPIDYSRYAGGVYSSEWFWAKILHTLRVDAAVRQAAYSWVEHCDWIPFLLTGGTDVHQMKRSRCAAGHKALWHKDFDGLPPNDFWIALDPLLDGLRTRLFSETYTSDEPAGTLSPEWAERLGLSPSVIVGVGAFDAHMGAVGGQIEPYHLSKVMGTSTCDMLVAPLSEVSTHVVKGICGQVEGSVIPGMLGLEAGQSAFGDVYAWFTQLLSWPLQHLVAASPLLDAATAQRVAAEATDRLLAELSAAAAEIEPGADGIIALDWLNGRRTPDASQVLKGAIAGLQLASDAPRVFRALVEATCFGARKIIDRFVAEGIPIEGVIGLGGVAKKSPLVMQIMADVLNRPIRIARSEQTCALGAAMFAAVAAGVHPTVEMAMQTMGSGFDATYVPDAVAAAKYDLIYQKYAELGEKIEDFTLSSLVLESH